MKWKRLPGIWAAAFMLLSACGAENDEGGVVSLEPYSLEAYALESDSPEPYSSGSDLSESQSPESDSPESHISESNASESGSPESHASESPSTEANSTAGAAGTDGRSDNAVSGAGVEPRSSAADPLSGTYGGVYLQVVNDDESEDNNNTKTYSLIWLDDDEIPELVVYDNLYESYSIYTVRDNELFCMADSLITVELTYYERKGVIADFARWNGGGDTGGYGKYFYQVSGDRTLTSEDQPVLSYSYNAVYNAEGEYTGTGVTDYFCMGQEIDEGVYQEKLGSLGITEVEDRTCMENSCNREEIIALLKR